MSEWTVVVVIIALVGLVVSVATPIVKLTSSITKLTTLMDEFGKDLSGLTERNTESHQRLWSKNTEQDKRLANHEQRIAIVEHKTN